MDIVNPQIKSYTFSLFKKKERESEPRIMAQAMLYVLACIILLMAVVVEGAPPPPKQQRCRDPRFSECFHQIKTCPAACPRDCDVDCWSCEARCIPPPSSQPSNHTPPPPPAKPQVHPQSKSSPPPKKEKCKNPRFSDCFHVFKTCPDSCPRECEVDCWSCEARCIPGKGPKDSPPPPKDPKPSPPPPKDPKPSPPPPHSPPVVSPKKVFCKIRKYAQCYRQELRCPSACADQCVVDCVTCSPVCDCNRPGAVCQDPRFTGADGIAFYFHGKKNHDFCILTDTNLHINGHFIGRRNEKMKRDFTWVQALGILFGDNQIYVGAKKTATWFDTIDHLDLAFNGNPILLSEGEGVQWKPSLANGVSITRSRATNAVVIEVEGNFQIKANVVPITEKDSQIHNYGITKEDCFAHLDLSFKFYSLTGEVNGILGQTYASNYVSRAKMGVDMPVLGGDKEFRSTSLFTTDCAVARFSGNPLNSSSNFQYTNLRCSSGLDGRGVICK